MFSKNTIIFLVLALINTQKFNQIGSKKTHTFQVGLKDVEPLSADKSFKFTTPELLALYNSLKGSINQKNCANQEKFGLNNALVLNKCLETQDNNDEILTIKIFYKKNESTEILWRMSYKKVAITKADKSQVLVFVGTDCKSFKQKLKPSPIMATCESMAFLGSTIVETVSGKLTNNISTGANNIDTIVTLAECIKDKVVKIYSKKKIECWVEALNPEQLKTFLKTVQEKMDEKDLQIKDGKIVYSKISVDNTNNQGKNSLGQSGLF